MFKLNKKTILLVVLLVFIANSALASEFVPDTPPEQLSYLFHLYYDNGQLFADRDFDFKYDVIPEEFIPETYNTQFPFKGEIVNFKNEVAEEFLFDPRRGNPDFLKGKVEVKAPYVPDGQKAVFYDAQGRPLLTIFVSESSFCNDDAICDFERGEDDKTCPNDCKVLPTTNDQQPTTNNGGQTDMLKAAIYVLIIAGAALGGWFGWKWYKSRQESPPMMPFPQNPNVQ